MSEFGNSGSDLEASLQPELGLSLALDVPDELVEMIDGPLIERVIRQALLNERVTGEIEVTIVVTDDPGIHELNRQYRGVDSPTDVLSFPIEEDAPGAGRFVLPPGIPRNLGDIVISFPRVIAQAEEYGHSSQRELGYLAVHGTLHLLGYDHETESDRQVMREKEEAALVDLPRS